MRTRARAALAAAAGLATLAAGCGGSSGGSTTALKAPTTAATPKADARPAAAPAGDVEAAQSSPLPGGLRGTRAAPKPGSVHVPKQDDAQSGVSPGAPSDAEIAAELKELEKVQKRQRQAQKNARPTDRLSLTAKGNAITPDNAPDAIAAIIAGGNAIARFPYVYGGGHASFVDTAYDCSGSVSYALATAGLLNAPLTSGDLSKWGAPGPGKWVTIYANAGHVFMYVAGRRFDTSGRAGVHGSRWQMHDRNVGGFKVRHPPGL